jgi:hypothetical protein
VVFQHRIHREKEHWQNLGMYSFRNLNKATPKDEYPMLIADMLINNASGYRVIRFLDGNAGYNQIFMAKGDMSYRCFLH